MMRRRSFLSALAAAMTMDPERLLWVPGQKLISVPNVSVVEDELAIFQFSIFDSFMKSPYFSFVDFMRLNGKVIQDMNPVHLWLDGHPSVKGMQ